MSKNKKLLLVTTSPHIKTAESTSWIMFNVIIALLPTFVAACYFYGRRALFTVFVSVAFAIGFEYVSRLLMGRLPTVSDLSCIVTGVMIAFCLPVTVPVWVIAVGNFFAIVIVKQMFGGIAQNIVNPAVGALAFLLLTFNRVMTDFINPLLGFSELIPDDRTAAVTSLAQLKASGVTTQNTLNLFLGNTAGNLGETSAALLLIGGIYLIVRRISDWRIPLSFLGTVTVLALAKSMSSEFVLCQLFSGSLFIAAFFMACDPVTSPETPLGKVIFGVICGALTCFIRFYGTYAEGAVFAVLAANLMTPLIDHLIPVGFKRPVKKRSAGQKAEVEKS